MHLLPSTLPLARFHPRLFLALHHYSRERFTKDVGAGLTVGIVALPLAMAFAIASGLKPEAGLFTAIIAGFFISLLGGSRVQIGGPAGAFIVIVYGIVQRYGLGNLLIATALSGLVLFTMGLFRIGSLIRFIPVTVVIGFTNGIAVLIALSQIKDFLGLTVIKMPADFFGILSTLKTALPSFNLTAFIVALASLGVLVFWQNFGPKLGTEPVAKRLQTIPGSIVALVLATLAVRLLGLPVETIGSRFGGIPSSLPHFIWPDLSWESAKYLLMPTLTLAMLGAIESLLCARVADGMMQSSTANFGVAVVERHDPNQELMAQGVANFITPFFGGMPATGTIARTVTNVKNGATSPIAGIVHALTLLVVILIASKLATYVPLATLAAILMFVAWNMGEWRAFAELRHFPLPYRVTLLTVFFLTVVFDLTVAVEVGLVAACVTFIYRVASLSRATEVSAADYPLLENHPAVKAWRLYGALFFGTVQVVETFQSNLPATALVLDLKNVIYLDSSGAETLIDLAKQCQKQNVRLLLCGLINQPADMATRSGLVDSVYGEASYNDVKQAIEEACALNS